MGTNDLGKIVGWSRTSEKYGSGDRYKNKAALWTEDITEDNGYKTTILPSNYNFSHAKAINDKGQIVGDVSSGGFSQPVIWHPDGEDGYGEPMLLPGFSGSVSDLPASAINEEGVIVGNASGGGAIVWTPDENNPQNYTPQKYLGSLPALHPRSRAFDINENGHIAGYSNTDDGVRAVVWIPDGDAPTGYSITILSISDQSHAYGINDLGQIAGYSTNALGTVATVWTPDPDNLGAYQMLALGTQVGCPIYALAYSINELGQVIGETYIDGDCNWNAVLWETNPGPPPSDDQVDSILDQIDVLVFDGLVNGGQANALEATLDGILAMLDKGNDNAACNGTMAFLKKIEALVASGKLTQEQAMPLFDAADTLGETVCEIG